MSAGEDHDDARNPSRPSSPSPASPRANKPSGSNTAATANAPSSSSKESSRLPACEACRSRKIKCDALVPACTPCRKAQRECVGRDKTSSVSRGLIWELQEKVRELEQKLSSASTSTSAPQPPASLHHSASYDATLHRHPDRRGSLSQSHHDLAAHSSSSSMPPSANAATSSGRTAKRRKTDSHADDGTADDSDAREDRGRLSSQDPPPLSPSLQPSPNDLIQETSTIFETLSSNLPAAARPRDRRRPLASANASAAHDVDRAGTGSSRASGQPGYAADPSAPHASRHPQAGLDDAGRTSRRMTGSKSAASTFNISTYDRGFIDRLVKRYIVYMNGALPVINEVRLREMTDRIYRADLELRLAGRAATRSSSPKPAERYTVLMALAIALASLSRSHHFSSELKRLGNKLWSEAQRLMPEFSKVADLDKLRAILLQLLYAFLIPKSGSVWELSGAAMRLITELNLHFDREADSVTHQKYDAEMLDTRRRLFWTAYCLDRSLAVALGRPPGLSDAWIHVQLPSLRSDHDLIQQGPASGNASAVHLSNGNVDRLKQSYRSHIALRRIQSEIHCRLHSVNPRDYSLDHDGISLSQPLPPDRNLASMMEYGPPTPNVAWQERMVKKLQDWRAGCAACTNDAGSSSFGGGAGVHGGSSGGGGVGGGGISSFNDLSVEAIPFVTTEWMELNYNLTLSLLFRPSPNNPRPDQQGLRRAFVASGEVMKLYKLMHRTSKINFPWLATHNLFISGLTYLNSLEKLARQGLSNPTSLVDIIFNVQSCTSVLEALTSLEDGYNTRVRDTFDTAAAAVLKIILEPSRGGSGGANGGTVLESTVSGSLTPMPNPLRAMMGGTTGHGGFSTSGGGGGGGSNSSSGNSSGAGAAGLGSGAGGSNSGGGGALMMAATTSGGGFDSSLRSARQGSPALRTFPTSSAPNSFMSPTWLSDATWNTVAASNSAPPGSTILVAAPPRNVYSQLQRPTSSLSSAIHSAPAISQQRTTAQGSPPLAPTTSYGQAQQDGFSVGGAGSHHAFSGMAALSPVVLGSISPSTVQRNGQDGHGGGGIGTYSGNGGGGSNGVTTDGNQTNGSQNGGGGTSDTGPTFGFHNWLLQPYEGGGWGLDSTSGFLGGGGSGAFDPSISPSSSTRGGGGGGSGGGGGLGNPFFNDGSSAAGGGLGNFSDGTPSVSGAADGAAGGYDFSSVFEAATSGAAGVDEAERRRLKAEPANGGGGGGGGDSHRRGSFKLPDGEGQQQRDDGAHSTGGGGGGGETRTQHQQDTSFLEMLADVSRSL
ncbi:uncharacterized protein PSFLO_01531 [Pseudozyma flocculosa]|uniref:Zn(2)-C6 fungal-type domain-containing protein n=1 Tax=Pseudozyma flocculosa TaxID=84751 RepID=A0A5C3EW25_9BASI|nr:uncharacterized protein PSFLO_01531 [Pseudozyma flocculosa]